MVIIWDKICEIFTTLVRPSRRKTRVTFSPSTLHREIIRHTKLSASANPFFNFLAEVRMKANGDHEINSKPSMTRRDIVRLAKTAGRLWNSMSDEQKQPYRTIAMEQRKLKRLRGRRRKSIFTSHRRKRKRSCLSSLDVDAWKLPSIETTATPADSIITATGGELVRKNH